MLTRELCNSAVMWLNACFRSNPCYHIFQVLLPAGEAVGGSFVSATVYLGYKPDEPVSVSQPFIVAFGLHART